MDFQKKNVSLAKTKEMCNYTHVNVEHSQQVMPSITIAEEEKLPNHLARYCTKDGRFCQLLPDSNLPNFWYCLIARFSV